MKVGFRSLDHSGNLRKVQDPSSHIGGFHGRKYHKLFDKYLLSFHWSFESLNPDVLSSAGPSSCEAAGWVSFTGPPRKQSLDGQPLGCKEPHLASWELFSLF